MDLTKDQLLLTCLLAGTIVTSYTYMLRPEDALGVTTSYSTVVRSSTYTSIFFVTTFSTTTQTRYKATTDVTDRLVQYETSGPCVQIEAVWKETEYRTAEVDVLVKNLSIFGLAM